MKNTLIDLIEQEKIIAIARGIPTDTIIRSAEAIYEGGIRLLEVTFGAGCDTAEQIRLLTEHFGDRMKIGAGTVLTAEQVALTKEAGGGFVISPNADPAVIRKTKELGLVSIPGAFTATEAQAAYDAGADFVKLFPASELSPSYCKALAAPLPHIRFLAVGGINEQNMTEYLAVGVAGFGIGSDLLNRKRSDDPAALTAHAKKYSEVIRAWNGCGTISC